MQLTFLFLLGAAAYRGPSHPTDEKGWYNPFPGAAKRAEQKLQNEKKFDAAHGNLHSLAKNVHEAKTALKMEHHKKAPHHAQKAKVVKKQPLLAPKKETNDFPKAKVVKHHSNNRKEKVALVAHPTHPRTVESKVSKTVEHSKSHVEKSVIEAQAKKRAEAKAEQKSEKAPALKHMRHKRAVHLMAKKEVIRAAQ